MHLARGGEPLVLRARIYATDIMKASALAKRGGGFSPSARMVEYTRNYLAAGGTRAFSDYLTRRRTSTPCSTLGLTP